jgi:hypothetical protein
MLDPLSLESIARDVIRARLDEAAHDALVDSLPQAATVSRPFVAARQHLADGLRALASRLDPSIVCEPRLVIGTSR